MIPQRLIVDDRRPPLGHAPASLRLLDSANAASHSIERLAELVGRDRRVLVLGGGDSSALLDALRGRGCRIVLALTGTAATAPDSESCERVDADSIASAEWRSAAGVEPFDTIIAADTLAQVDDPAETLRVVKEVMAPGGCLIAAVPNVAHGSVRLALWRGRFPDGEPGVLDPSHRRFFTRESFLRLLESADYAVGQFEAPESPIREADAPTATDPHRVDELAHDPDARAHCYLAVAYPLPAPALVAVQTRLRDAALAVHSTRHEAATLRAAVAALQNRVAALTDGLDRAAGRERETRRLLLAAHERLAKGDQELHDLITRLVAERDALALREPALIEERDAYRARLDRLRGSLPGRLYRLARKVIRPGA